MGSSVARKGDAVFAAADKHPSMQAPPVPVTGNITEGSPDVFVNNFPVARKGDGGTHAACTGSNSFVIDEGSSVVFANDEPVALAGGKTIHCGDITADGGSPGNILSVTSPNTFA